MEEMVRFSKRFKTKMNTLFLYTKKTLEFIFWVILFLSIFLPNSVDYWLPL